MAFNSSKITAITGTDGDDGSDGAAGAAAGFGTPAANASNVAVDGSGDSQDATITVTPSGPDTAKVFTFALGIPVGTTGATGATGSIDLAADQAWTGSQRATIKTDYADDTTTFYLKDAQNWTWTVTSSGAASVDFETDSSTSALTTSSGQSGFILLTNSAGTITLGSTCKSDTTATTGFIDTISGKTGTFLISYLCDGTNVYLSTTKALA